MVEKIFRAIENAKSISDLKEICEYPEISDSLIDQAKYPRINFTISAEDINFLIASGKVNQDYFTLSDNFMPETLMEKLLYSLIWKQGDVEKISKIIQGINNAPNDSDSIVFYYFGKHLANKRNPIIDQHVIRAFKCHEKGISYANLKALSQKHNKDDVYRYLSWIKEVALKFTDIEDCIYEIDRILFALGKTIKVKTPLVSRDKMNVTTRDED